MNLPSVMPAAPRLMYGLLQTSALQSGSIGPGEGAQGGLPVGESGSSVGGAWENFRRLISESVGEQAASSNTIRRNQQAFPAVNSPEAATFNRLVDLKVTTAQTLMHLDRQWRSKLYDQLDNLIDAENWDFDDELPTRASYQTFLRMLDQLRLPARPGLAATPDGNIIATWTAGINRLTLECQPADVIRWIVTRDLPDGLARAAGQCHSVQLPRFLKEYEPEIWFND